ncbi:MAG TPA: prepilin-type N-terminal cleavage/methylation domain-containing protein [Candidatus Saccharimonadales bacterium]|nr:prepilin-type N-terminal cleavage/methylation domain-containing protein [Candidatus Saccharimonadales bacterium]
MFIASSRNHSKQRGDTIVEVLIAMAVVSLILGGAYVTTNRSLLATRSAQERSIALKLAESQMERLKSLVATNPDQIFGAAAPSTFCISNTNTVQTAPSAACGFNAAGAGNSTTEPVFKIAITKSGNQFNLNETWFDVNGKITDKLQMKYRIYQ